MATKIQAMGRFMGKAYRKFFGSGRGRLEGGRDRLEVP